MDEQAEEFKEDFTALAPDSIDGKTAHMSIIFGSGESPSSGSFTVTYTTTTYSLTDTGGTMTNETGTYTYTKTANNQATMVNYGEREW